MQPDNLRTYEQYMLTRRNRLQEGQIENQSVYDFLGRLATGPIEAIRLPIKTGIHLQAGTAAVILYMLDMDLNFSSTNRGSMEDGLWRPAQDDPFTIEYRDGRKDDLVEGYLLGYDEGPDPSIVETAQSIRLPQEFVGIGYNPN